ncbi:endoplasmic reticulum-Golgi intermediate compartment protein 3-like [Gymnogyps californianus]|uniref:endoplasmic reticulum-Golgi intermediate compartment protein 3-like n=1 Tax=Gymnogyps californianus TaxID=33616 RepID=UPI0021C76551|nr:endoplasmic reticulum-Golgi intermediate compartment protein 3-like [Gymnogyps californianus]
MASLWRLKRFDAFPKPLEDFRVKTCGGALVTAVSGLIVVLLFFSELQYYLPKEPVALTTGAGCPPPRAALRRGASIAGRDHRPWQSPL